MIETALPIWQAPMAGASTPAMAAAVSAAGGLGGLAIGHLAPDRAAAQLHETRQRTGLGFNVNLFCHAAPTADPAREAAWLETLRPHFGRFGAEPPASLEPAYPPPGPEVLRLLLDFRPALVSFHFGLPHPDFVRALREAGVLMVASATSLDEARQVQAAGLDAVVAQGYEAGGHRGCFDPEAPDEQLSTAVLTRLLVTQLELPVIAAGGIMDAAGVAGALRLGAVAAQLGTAYLACPESAAEPAHRERLLAGPGRTVMTRALSGRPARCLVNAFTALPQELAPAYPTAYTAGKALHAAARAAGDPGYGAHWAGQGAPLAQGTGSRPAAEVTRQLCQSLS